MKIAPLVFVVHISNISEDVWIWKMLAGWWRNPQQGQCFQEHSIHGKTIYQYLRHRGQVSDGQKPVGMDKAATKTWTHTGPLSSLSQWSEMLNTHKK